MKEEFKPFKRHCPAGEAKKTSPGFLIIVFLAALASSLACFYLLGSFPDQNQTSQPKKAKKAGARIKAEVLSIFDFTQKDAKKILLLGIPGPGNDAPNLTDTILIANINYNPIKISLISIPRDLWIKIPQTENWTKINALYSLGKEKKDHKNGIEMIKKKAQEIIGQKIDNYALIDLSVLKYLIDSQDGISVMVKEDIYDPSFPGPNHSYQTLHIPAGWRYMDGETASKYARTRHSEKGDFDRLARQQQIAEALKQKLAALDLIGDMPEVLKILSELHSRLKTDIPFLDIPEYWEIFKKYSPEDIKNIVIEKENRLLGSAGITIDGQPVAALAPMAGKENYSEIQKYIQENL